MNEIIFWILVVLGLPILFLGWLTRKTLGAARKAEDLDRRFVSLEGVSQRLRNLEMEVNALKSKTPSETTPPVEKPLVDPFLQKTWTPTPPIVQPEIPPVIHPAPDPLSETTRIPSLASIPPKIEENMPSENVHSFDSPSTESTHASSPINWEKFMGVKMFSWVGGLALFLGVAFFVKYSFENNLISPELRVALGFLTGLGLLVSGVLISRKEYRVTSQTLCATGTVCLYAVTFAAHSYYHIITSPILTFLLMILITTTAFLLSVSLDAQVVAILGLLGGFLTPLLLSTGQDNPWGLFGYVAMLDIGLILVAFRKQWHHLALLSAIATIFMQIRGQDKGSVRVLSY